MIEPIIWSWCLCAGKETHRARRYSFRVSAARAAARQSAAAANVSPGQSWVVQQDVAGDTLTLVSPSGKKSALARDERKRFRATDTEQLGVYEIQENGRLVERFTSNLFSPLESDIKPRETFQVGAGAVVEAGKETSIARRHAWKWLILAAIGVLLFEWYIYNRRIYL